MAWRLAKSLETLRTQVNKAYPNRSKISDGTIGDTAHAAGYSDHNPNPSGVVCALDLTHDPKNGFDAHALADHLRTNRHSNLKYIISNSRICGASTGWRWQTYQGANPHSSHIHISVGVGTDGYSQPPYDSTTAWSIKTVKGDEMIADTNANYKMWSDLRKYILGDGMTRASFRKNYVGKSYRSRLDALLKHSQAGEYIEELAKQAPTAPRNEKGVVISYLEGIVSKLKDGK